MNSFGSATKQFGLCNPTEVLGGRARFRREVMPDLDRVNSFYCPVGHSPFCGFVLLPRYEYDQLDPYSTTLQLNIGDASKSDNVGTLKNLSIARAKCATRGLASDPNALYLIELTDGRGVLHNKWFQFPLTAQYNVRAPAYPQVFHPSSTNGGTPWTWSTMLQDIWTGMSAFLGAWPGLPITPSGTPEGFWFTGVPALPALCEILDHLGLALACDLTRSSPFTIVNNGASDAALTALQTKYATNLEDDYEWLDVGAARVPGTIKVLFRRRNSVYGTEETVTYRSDGPYQWDMSSTYSVSVSAPSFFTGATGTHFIWSDFTVRYDADNQPVAADVTTAAAIAAERAQQYFNRIYSGTSGAMDKVYAGALPFTTGAQVDSVRWWFNAGSDSEDDRRGWKTAISRVCE